MPKAPLTGIICRNGFPAHPEAHGGFVSEMSWASCQSARGAPIGHGAALRAAVNDGSTATATPTKVNASYSFAESTDLARIIKVVGAGAGGADYYGIITAVNSATQVTVAPNISTTTSGKTVTIFVGNSLDQDIRQVRTYTNSDPTIQAAGRALGIKAGLLRANGSARGAPQRPDWYNTLVGTVSMTEPVDGGSGPITVWWKTDSMDGYDEWQDALADFYDNPAVFPEVREIVVCGPSTFYPECFLRQNQGTYAIGSGSAVGRANGAALFQAGYTKAKDITALNRAIAAHKAWENTRSVLSFNNLQYFTTNANPTTNATASTVGAGSDAAASETLMDTLQDATNGLGPLAVLGNNDYNGENTGVFAKIFAHGPKGTGWSSGDPVLPDRCITLQTKTAKKLGDDGVTIQELLTAAVRDGATAVEPPGTWPYKVTGELAGTPEAAGLSVAEAQSFNAQLAANFRTTTVTTVQPPTNLHTTGTPAAGSVALAWTAPASLVGTEDHYEVRRRVTGSGAAFASLADVTFGTNSYTDTTAAAGTSYEYRVKTWLADGSFSDPTDILQVDVPGTTPTVDTTAPPVPTVTCVAEGDGIRMTWTDVTDVGTGGGPASGMKEWRIHLRQTSPVTVDLGRLNTIAHGNPRSYLFDADDGVVPEATYVGGVKACDNNDNVSATGEGDPVTTPAPPAPPAPTRITGAIFSRATLTAKGDV